MGKGKEKEKGQEERKRQRVGTMPLCGDEAHIIPCRADVRTGVGEAACLVSSCDIVDV